MRNSAAWQWVGIAMALSGCGGGNGGNDAGDTGSTVDTGGMSEAGNDAGSLPDGDASALPDACPSTSQVCNGACIDVRSDPANCGACGTICAVGATCSASACACPNGQIECNGVCTAVASADQCPPRQIAPLSASMVTSQRPALHFSLPAGASGAHVEICADAACTQVQQGMDASGSSVTPGISLSRGWHFWHARAAGATSYGPTWEFWVGARSAPVDTSWGMLLDVNRDGAPEVASSSDSAEYLFMGSRTGVSTTAMEIPVPDGAMQLNAALTRAGDVNGDGFGDLVGTGLEGGAYLYFGTANGLSPTAMRIESRPPGVSSQATLAPAGDVNGDGYADLLAGLGADDTALVYYGGTHGFGVQPTTLTGMRGSHFGATLAGACDVNGDGFADVLVGGTLQGSTYVALYMGGASGLGTTPTILGDGTGLRYGEGLACAGDVNGDGYADVAVGDPASRTVYLYTGGAGGLDANATMLLAPTGTGYIEVGSSLSGIGDANGDGYDDLLVAAKGSHAAFLFPGSASGPTLASTTLTPAGAMDFGGSTASTGDLDGDGLADAAVGTFVGSALYLFRGNATGLDGTTPVVLMAPDGAISFGYRIASLGGSTRPSFSRRPIVVLSAKLPSGDVGEKNLVAVDFASLRPT